MTESTVASSAERVMREQYAVLSGVFVEPQLAQRAKFHVADALWHLAGSELPPLPTTVAAGERIVGVLRASHRALSAAALHGTGLPALSCAVAARAVLEAISAAAA